MVTWFRPEYYYGAQPWRGQLERVGGGTMINQSIHTLDLMHLFGGNPLTCKGHLLNLLDYKIEVEDTAVARYEFEENISGLYFATNSYAMNSLVELEVITERRSFVIKDYKLFEYRYNSDDIFESTKSYYGQDHLLAIQTFYKAVIDKTEDYIHIEDALGSMLMIDMMRKSSKTKETVHASMFTKSE